jgi:preprotein translocase subunit SecG
MSGLFDFYKGAKAAEDVNDFEKLGMAARVLKTASESFKSSYSIAADGRMISEGAERLSETAQQESAFTFTSGLSEGTNKFTTIFAGTPIVEGLDDTAELANMNNNVEYLLRATNVSLKTDKDMKAFLSVCNKLKPLLKNISPEKLQEILNKVDPDINYILHPENPDKLATLIKGAESPTDAADFLKIYEGEADLKKYTSIRGLLNDASKLGENPSYDTMEKLGAGLRGDPPFGKAVFSGKSHGEILDQLVKLDSGKAFLKNFKSRMLIPARLSKIAPEGNNFGKRFLNFFVYSTKEADTEKDLLELAQDVGGDKFEDLEKATEALRILKSGKMSKFDKLFFLGLTVGVGSFGLYEFFTPPPDPTKKPSTKIRPPHSKREEIPSCNNKDRTLGDMNISDWGLECATDISEGDKKQCDSSPSPYYIDNPLKKYQNPGNDCDSCVSEFFVAPNLLSKHMPFDSSEDYESMVDNCQNIIDEKDKIDDNFFEDIGILIILLAVTFGVQYLIQRHVKNEFIYWSLFLFIFSIQVFFIFPSIIKYIVSVFGDGEEYTDQLKTIFPDGLPDGVLTDGNIGGILGAMTYIGEGDTDTIRILSFIGLMFISVGVAMLSKPKDEESKWVVHDMDGTMRAVPATPGQGGGERRQKGAGKKNILPKNILPKTLNKFNKWLIIFLLVLAILINYFYNSNRSTMDKKNYIQEMKKKRSRKENIQVKEENKNLSYEPSIVFGGQFI